MVRVAEQALDAEGTRPPFPLGRRIESRRYRLGTSSRNVAVDIRVMSESAMNLVR